MRALSPLLFLVPLVTASLAACGGDDPVDSPFGATTIFVVVNPPENAGNSVDVPATFGTAQAGVRVDAEPGGSAVTDVTGLAILEDDLAAGDVDLVLDGGPAITGRIDSDVEVRGGKMRLRGVTITGDLSVFGDALGMAFSVVRGAAQLDGQGIAFLGNVFCGGANVPSSNAALFDNEGLPPLARPGAPVCP